MIPGVSGTAYIQQSQPHKIKTEVKGPFPYSKEEYREKANQQKLKYKKEYEGKGYKNVKVTYRKIGNTQTSNIDNPIESAGYKDAIRLNSKPRQFYLRFGYLLEYIKDNILPRIKIGDDHDTNPQIFNIDTDEWGSHMYSLPNQISLDPRVCIVGNRNFNSGQGNTQVFPQLPYFREIDNGESKNSNAAYPLNIYLNFEFILECLKPDDRGDVNIFEFISSICTGLNKALGGINNLEPIIDENTNTLSIIDTTPIPGYSSKSTKSYILQIYGYKNTKYNYSSNFVRNVDLKTTISPEYATMITVGATAGGYVKGTEATAFSKWNVGLRDRFKEDFTPGNLSSVKKANEIDEAEVNYATEFLKKGYKTRYGLTDLEGNFLLNTDAIERNLSVVTEYYKYLIAKESVNQDTSGGTIGFIPFKLNLTLDGISGIKIYNKLQVNTEFLPKVYGKTVDLIVTGVSHNLAGNDWTTQIETTVIPKTGKQSTAVILPQVIEKSIDNATKVTSCDQIPTKNKPKGLVKSTTTNFGDLFKIIISQIEGYYFHPLNSLNKDGTVKDSFKYMVNSGETLWGIDRPNGDWEKQGKSGYSKKRGELGKAFWDQVDSRSGYKKYKYANQTLTPAKWKSKLKSYPHLEGAWGYNDSDTQSPNALPNTFKKASELMEFEFDYYMDLYFKPSPEVKKLIYSDGRLKFMYMRSLWSGIGNMQNDANSIIKIYNSGTKTVEDLACKELAARWNRRTAKVAHDNFSYMKDLIGL